MNPYELSAIYNPYSVFLFTKNVDLLPHQISALFGEVRRDNKRLIGGILRVTFPVNVLLADETGLGKTIMIGMILFSLKLRGIIKNAIIVAPKSILYQWREELSYKFNLLFKIIESGKDFANINVSKPYSLIVSMDLLKRKEGMEFLDSLHDKNIDITVIDEAHHVISPKMTQRMKMLLKLKDKSKSLILSTATPFRGDSKTPEILKDVLGDNYIYIRRFKEDVIDFNGKKIFKKRISHTIRIDPNDEWALLYQKLNAFIDNLHVEPIVKVILKKRLSSSVYSFLVSLNKLFKENVFGETDDVIGKEPDALDKKLKDTYLTKADISLIDSVKNIIVNGLDPKEQFLLRFLRENISSEDKVIIFTEYVSTLMRLHDVLSKNNIEHVMVHGGLKFENIQNVINKFKKDASLKILLATDVAGEGLNLQAANIQINYDIPWSPLKLEQRFGRIHRYGQTKNVFLYNFYLPNTIDEKIVKILLDKLEKISLNLGDWIFDYIGEIVRPEEIKNVIINDKQVNIDYVSRLNNIKKTKATPQINDNLYQEIHNFVKLNKNKIKVDLLPTYFLETEKITCNKMQYDNCVCFPLHDSKPLIATCGDTKEEAKRKLEELIRFYYLNF